MQIKKTETLTPEQEAAIVPHRDWWLNFVWSCKNRLDKGKAKKGVEWMYFFCKKEKPIVIFMDSPLGCQVAANIFKTNIGANIGDNIGANIWANIGDNIWANIGDNIGANIWANIRANIRDNIRANIGDNIRANIRDNIRANIGDNIRANIRANIGDNIRANIRDNKLEYYNTSYYCNISDFGWVSWVDYYLKMNLIKTDKEIDFNSFKELLLSGVFETIQFENMCIVSDMPTKIMRDAENRLHCVDGVAVEFSDGFGQHYIHGIYLKPYLFEKLSKKEITFNDWVKEENQEIKSCMLSFMEEKWGGEYLFRFISDNLKKIDTYTDKKDDKYLVGTSRGMNIGVYTLFYGNVNNIEMAFVRCYCPSTDRMFFLSVDPVNKNAKDAIASLYRVPAKLKNEIKYIQRQGERFSTVFTNNGKSLLQSLTKEETETLVPISGEEYFSKMKYEY